MARPSLGRRRPSYSAEERPPSSVWNRATPRPLSVSDQVARNLAIPIYMIFPRLFTCPTLTAGDFKLEFEVNLIVIFGDGYMITENFPITLVRS